MHGAVGVGHGPDAGMVGELSCPGRRDPATSPSTIGRTASEVPPTAATAAAGAAALDQDVDQREGAREGEGGEIGRDGRRGQQRKRRDKQENTRYQGRPAATDPAPPDGLRERRHTEPSFLGLATALMRGGLVGSADGPHHHRRERPPALPGPPDLGIACYNPAARPNGPTTAGPGLEAPDPDRSAQQPMHLAAARRLPRLLPLAIAVALLGAGLVLAGNPAAAQAPQSKVTINGTAANKWEPANAAVRTGGTVTFRITGGVTHPVVSGDGSKPEGDDRFDASDCGLQQMSKVGDSCQVKFPEDGNYPYFCQVHVTQGMKGVITVGTSAGGATTTTGGEAGSVVEPPSAAAPPSSGRPAIYWAGWGLFALGALLALVLIALYVRFWPGFSRPKS